MKGMNNKVQLWKVLGVVLSGLLILSVCVTAGFAEQMEPVPEGTNKGHNPVMGAQGAGEGLSLHTMSTAHTINVINKYLDDDGTIHESSDYGTVTASVNNQSASQANKNDIVTLTAAPKSADYALGELKYSYYNGYEEHEQSIISSNSFYMPDNDVTVTATFYKRHRHDDIEFEPWMSTNSLPPQDQPNDYYLTNDVTLTDTWTASVGGGFPTRLCLNGHRITLEQGNEDSKPVILVKQGDNGAPSKLVLYDTSENEGAITHADGKKGAGVSVENGGELVMKGGGISSNTGDYGVRIKSGGSFTMEGGVIVRNTGSPDGGGVAVEGGTFTMSDGTIQNNGGDGVQYGGGVFINGGTFNLSGGTITQNTARIGGGVAGKYPYKISVSGSPRVTDNQAHSENSKAMGDNLCLLWPDKNTEPPITISGPLGKDAKIGVSTIRDNSHTESLASSDYTDGVFTTGYKAAQSTDPWNYFTSDDPNRQVLWIPNGQEAQLTVARHITVAQGITGGTVTLSKNIAAEGETIDIQATANVGWDLVSVTAKNANGKEVPVKDNKLLVVPASDVVVVSATFKKKPTPPEPEPNPEPEPTPTPAPADLHVTYTAHVQTKGDLPAVSNGKVAGTTGESRRLEAISATVSGGGIEYRAHLRGRGWGSWVADGKQAGTTGEARRLEAIQMKLKGKAATGGYHVWYRVHSQTYGWLGWARDGEPAGTAGMSKRAEAYQVLVLQGNAKPAGYDASKPAYRAQAVADAHLQKSGWTGKVHAGIIGTTGKSRRIEGLRLYAPNQPFAGGIAYEVHEQGKGWTAKKSNGALAGTTGEARRIEAVRINLTDELAKHLSVWYRVHSQTYGWSGWACNGASAGTQGLAKRAEAVDIRILPKNAPAPGSTASAFRTR